MKNICLVAVAVAAMVTSNPAFADEMTVKLSVPGMNCASCPYIIEQAIHAVDGIKTVDAILDDRSAIVTFEDAITSIEEILKATADVGYVSSVIEDGNS